MNFKEPRRKKRIYHQLQRHFPIPLNKNDEWIMYTAHLSASGTCIAHPEEMTAVYCMGFFGKGSLSRGFPSFGKRQFGAPTQVRERQWKRRKQWLDDVKKLEAEPFLFNECSENNLDEANEESSVLKSADEAAGSEIQEEACKLNVKDDTGRNENTKAIDLKGTDEKHEENDKKKCEIVKGDEEDPAQAKEITSSEVKIPEDIKDDKGTVIIKKSENLENKIDAVDKYIDEVFLDSTEDEEICEIVDNDPNVLRIDCESQGSQDDICVLNNEIIGESLQSDSYMDLFEMTKEKHEENPNEMLVIPDSDSDNESYLMKIKPRIETEGFPIAETLQLTFEETFFLMYGLGCLQVINYDGNFFSIIEAWNHFNEQDKNFLGKYIVYHYFRSKGWVVKPGLKCGGDFVLYKKGPPFYHASYIVLIEVADADNLLRDDSRTPRDISWDNIHTLNRLSTTLGKELLIAQVLWPSTVSQNSNPVPLEALSEFTVRELLIRRWNPNETCETIPLDDDDGDSDEDSS